VPTVGLPELIVIALILILVFGGSRLPKLGEDLGRTFGKLKRGASRGDPSPDSRGDDAAAQDADIVD